MITKIFGENCKRAKVFDILLSHPHTEYTKKDMAECADISRNTLDNFIDKLVEYEIIKPTRRIKNGQLFRINLDSTITKALNSFQNQLADIEIEKEMKTYNEEIDKSIEPIKPFEEIVKREITVGLDKTTSGTNVKYIYFELPPKIKDDIELVLGSDNQLSLSPIAAKELHLWLGKRIKEFEDRMGVIKTTINEESMGK